MPPTAPLPPGESKATQREVVRNSDERLERMLRSIREATQPNTMDRQLLIAHLEKFLHRFDIRIPGDESLYSDEANSL